jgi:signal transduction histidine kinase
MVERGVQTEMLLHERTEALGAERERLRMARELHDSLAKTVEGLAMTASVLPARCEKNPARAAELAQTLAEDSRRAAIEARALMSDLRPDADGDLPLIDTIRVRAVGFAERFGLAVSCDCDGAIDEPSPQAKHEMIRILGEALANAARHGQATHVSVSLARDGDEQVLRVSDDGIGMPGPVDFEALKAAGHYGLAGMSERARSIDGSLSIEGSAGAGTVIAVRVPLHAGATAQDGRGLEPAGSPRYAGALSALRRRRNGAARSARIRA